MVDVLIKIYYDRSKLYVSQKVYSGDMCFGYGFFGMPSGVECRNKERPDERFQYGGDCF